MSTATPGAEMPSTTFALYQLISLSDRATIDHCISELKANAAAEARNGHANISADYFKAAQEMHALAQQQGKYSDPS